MLRKLTTWATKAVEAAVKAVNGETLEKFIDSGCSVVTKDNAQERPG